MIKRNQNRGSPQTLPENSFVRFRDSQCGQSIPTSLCRVVSGHAKALCFWKKKMKPMEEDRNNNKNNENDNSLLLHSMMIPTISFSSSTQSFREMGAGSPPPPLLYLRKLRSGSEGLSSDPQSEGCRPWTRAQTLHWPRGDGSRWRLLRSWEDRAAHIFYPLCGETYLDLKHFPLSFIHQELPFQHFPGCILCLVEFPLEFLQIRYTAR